MDPGSFESIEAGALRDRLDAFPGSFALLHVLPEATWEGARIPGAKNACVYDMEFLDRVRELVPDPTTPIVVYGAGRGAIDAQVAADKLVRTGYSEVIVFDGGLERWCGEGLPVEGTGVVGEPTALPEQGAYAVSVDESIIRWFGRNASTTHHGTVRIRQGAVEVGASILHGLVEIDMATIDSENLRGTDLASVLIHHLKSDDFFFVDRFPSARLSFEACLPDGRRPASAPNLAVKATLVLRGVCRELEFAATVAAPDPATLVAEAHLDFDRTLWDVVYGSSRFFRSLGKHLVYDPVSVHVRLNAKRFAAPGHAAEADEEPAP